MTGLGASCYVYTIIKSMLTGDGASRIKRHQTGTRAHEKNTKLPYTNNGVNVCNRILHKNRDSVNDCNKYQWTQQRQRNMNVLVSGLATTRLQSGVARIYISFSKIFLINILRVTVLSSKSSMLLINLRQSYNVFIASQHIDASVCLSVRPSVCPPRSDIESKRFNILS